MAMNVVECELMIDACKKADRKLRIAYRSHYETMDRAVIQMVHDRHFGKLKEFISGNSLNTIDPNQWRLKRA
jgi:predicted dehydrogenase